jgi:antitoxin CptB
MKNTKEFKQLLWHSRRGMRELDALFIPFTQHKYCLLSVNEQQAYRKIINQNDGVLFSWFLNSISAGSHQDMVNKILNYAKLIHR